MSPRSARPPPAYYVVRRRTKATPGRCWCEHIVGRSTDGVVVPACNLLTRQTLCRRYCEPSRENLTTSGVNKQGIRFVVGFAASRRTNCETFIGLKNDSLIRRSEERTHTIESLASRLRRLARDLPVRRCPPPLPNHMTTYRSAAGNLCHESELSFRIETGGSSGASSSMASRPWRSVRNLVSRRMPFDWSKCGSCADYVKVWRPSRERPMSLELDRTDGSRKVTIAHGWALH